MLYRASELKGYTLDAIDSTLGQCSDFLFDDQHWTIRYMVADTRRWLPGRKVLVSPIAMTLSPSMAAVSVGPLFRRARDRC